MKNALIIVACTILTAAPAAAQGRGAVSEKSKLQALMDANRDLTEKFDQTKKTEGAIAKAELELNGSQRALDAAERNFRRFGLKLKEQMTDIEREAARSGCPFGGETTDRVVFQSCNATADRLNAAMAEVMRKGQSQAEYAQKLAEERARITRGTLEASKKRDRNNKLQREIEAGFQQWQTMYNQFAFRSEAFEHLKRLAPAAAQDCDLDTRLGGYESMRTAIHCLERLFELAPAR